MSVPEITEFVAPLPDENDPATFPSRAEALFAWMVGTMSPEMNLSIAAINAALDADDTILTAVATLQASVAAMQARIEGRFVFGNVVYLSTGSGVYQPAAGVTAFEVTAIAPGAGGAAADGNSNRSLGSGGGAGGAFKKLIVAPVSDYNYLITPPGLGGASGNLPGSDASDLTFDDGDALSLVAQGGNGGLSTGPTSGSDSEFGGVGGGANGGDINYSGADGFPCAIDSGKRDMVGRGGNSPLGFGSGGAAGLYSDDGFDGKGYGSGGGGASSSDGSSYQGGDGAPGIIVINEYF